MAILKELYSLVSAASEHAGSKPNLYLAIQVNGRVHERREAIMAASRNAGSFAYGMLESFNV